MFTTQAHMGSTIADAVNLTIQNAAGLSAWYNGFNSTPPRLKANSVSPVSNSVKITSKYAIVIGFSLSQSCYCRVIFSLLCCEILSLLCREDLAHLSPSA